MSDTSAAETEPEPSKYNGRERILLWILRIAGVTGLFAIPCIFLPFSWMNWTHRTLGLGEMPNDPIVLYLARSLSAFYGVVSVLTLAISTDLRRYAPLVRVWAIVVFGVGVVLLGIDLQIGLPASWTIFEGPPTLLGGIVVFQLQKHIETDVAR